MEIARFFGIIFGMFTLWRYFTPKKHLENYEQGLRERLVKIKSALNLRGMALGVGELMLGTTGRIAIAVGMLLVVLFLLGVHGEVFQHCLFVVIVPSVLIGGLLLGIALVSLIVSVAIHALIFVLIQCPKGILATISLPWTLWSLFAKFKT
jgi:hypothetical protein